MRLWEEFLKQLDVELGKQTVDFWLRTLKLQKQTANTLYFTAADSFQVLWFEEHVRPIAQTRFVDESGQQWHIQLKALKDEPAADEQLNKVKSRAKAKRAAATNASAPSLNITGDTLDPSATFSSIHEHEGNRLAWRVLKKLSSDPQAFISEGYNPVYLYGPTATGKSSLLMAAANQLKDANKSVLYVTGETFTQHVVRAIRLGMMQEFRRFYRGIDVLLVDGVEVFTHKAATQEEFFHTFNTLHVGAKAIVVSAKVAPKDLKGIEARLVSRFEWGLLLSLEPALSAEMDAILKLQAQRLNLNLGPIQAKVLTEHFAPDPSELTKALTALSIRCHRHKLTLKQLIPSQIHELLAGLKAQQIEQQLTAERIVQVVSDFYGITTKDLLGKGQQREFSLPRQVAMFLCREKLQLPFLKIAELFGRDHSTVMTSCKLIEKQRVEKNSRVASELPDLIQKL